MKHLNHNVRSSKISIEKLRTIINHELIFAKIYLEDYNIQIQFKISDLIINMLLKTKNDLIYSSDMKEKKKEYDEN